MRVRFKQNKSHMGGPVPYGYRKVKGTDGLSRLEIDPDESVVVKLVYRLKLKESLGAKRLALRLDELGHRPRNGGKWSWSNVNRMVRNPIYTGVLVYGKRSDKLDRRSGKVRRVYHEEFLTHKDEKLRLISDSDFQKVQELLQAHVFRDYRLPADVRPFSKRVFCGCCGNVMFCRHQSLKRKNPAYFLVCGKRDKFGCNDEGCTNPNRPMEQAMIAWVQDGIRKVMEQKDRIIERAVELAEKALDTNDQRRGKIEGEIAKIEQGIIRFSRMLSDTTLNEDQTKGLLSQIGLLEKQRDEANVGLRLLAGEASFDRRALIREITAAFDEANQSILVTAGPAVFNRAVERFCGQVVALPDGKIVRRDDWVGVVPEREAKDGPKPARLLPAGEADPTGISIRRR